MSDVEMSPTGEYVLVTASFDDQVKVVDTATNTIVTSLPTGDFPIQTAFDATGEYATITNDFSDTATIIHVDGASSYVVANVYAGDGPLRLAYDPVHDRMGIGDDYGKQIYRLDPQTGGFLGTDSYASYGSLYQVLYDELSGEAVVLTGPVGGDPGHIHRAGVHIVLLAAPAYADDHAPQVAGPGGRSTDEAIAAVVMPGPDWLTVVN